LIALRAPARHLLNSVLETKDTDGLAEAGCPNEKQWIKCGERHFRAALGVDYRVATSASELP
jgi:hypothetical protein